MQSDSIACTVLDPYTNFGMLGFARSDLKKSAHIDLTRTNLARTPNVLRPPAMTVAQAGNAKVGVRVDTPSGTQVPLSLGMDHAHRDALTEFTDEELLEHSIKNPSAFEFLVVRYQRQFLERATFFIKNKDEAEDIVQDTFVRIYRFAPKFNGNAGSFRSWAMTILMNVARTKYQKKAKDWQRNVQLTPEHYESLAAPSKVEALEAKDIITRALEFVPHDTRHILELAFIKELPYKEIAKIENTTEGAIKTRVHRAKKTLRSIIGSLEE